MAKPATKDLEIVRGDTFDLYFGVSRNGARVNLTGATVTGQIRTAVDEAVVAGNFVCNITDQGTDQGGVLCTIPKETTDTFSFASAVYDIQIDFANGDRRTVLAGKINVTKDVTRGA